MHGTDEFVYFSYGHQMYNQFAINLIIDHYFVYLFYIIIKYNFQWCFVVILNIKKYYYNLVTKLDVGKKFLYYNF